MRTIIILIAAIALFLLILPGFYFWLGIILNAYEDWKSKRNYYKRRQQNKNQ